MGVEDRFNKTELPTIPQDYSSLPGLNIGVYPYKRQEDLAELNRPSNTAYYVVTKYSDKWKLHKPSSYDPHMIERLSPFIQDIARPGATAASSGVTTLNVIANLNKVVNLPEAHTGYDFYERLDNTDGIGAAISYQMNCQPFNDGAGTYADGTFYDFPCTENHYNDNLPRPRCLIAINESGKHIPIIGLNKDEIEEMCRANSIVYGVSAAPLLIMGGETRTLEDILTTDYFGDARHFFNTPYTNGTGDNQPVLANELVVAFRNGRGGEIFNSLKNKEPITFDIAGKGNASIAEKIIDAFLRSPVHGQMYANQVYIEDGKMTLPYLVPGCFNHTLTGLTNAGEFVSVHIPGQRKLFNGGQLYSGWDGATLEEMLNIARKVQRQYDLSVLFDSSQGRDPSAMVIATPAMINQKRFLVANQIEQLAQFIAGGVTSKERNTSPQHILKYKL